MKTLFTLLVAAVLTLLPGQAEAKRGADSVGTRVYVQVTDPAGEPIRTAVIRHPEEADRHRVNSVDGTWDEEVLYRGLIQTGALIQDLYCDRVADPTAAHYELTTRAHRLKRIG